MQHTVAELIELLKTMPSESLVVLASDEEGNGYRADFDVGDGFAYLDGDVGINVTDEMRTRGFGDEDQEEFDGILTRGGRHAVVLM